MKLCSLGMRARLGALGVGRVKKWRAVEGNPAPSRESVGDENAESVKSNECGFCRRPAHPSSHPARCMDPAADGRALRSAPPALKVERMTYKDCENFEKWMNASLQG